MKIVLILLICLLISGFLFLVIWRQFDHRTDRAEIARLIALQPSAPAVFDPAMVAGLPDPARRYFAYTILPGTPLLKVADIEMTGQFSLGNKNAPNYMKMTARQVLGAPYGFVWKMTAGTRPWLISGSDAANWTRFWMAGFIPVARQGGNSDHTRSAFGRYMAEAVFWTPAALLPGKNITWHAVDSQTSRVTVQFQSVSQDIYITVSDTGQPVTVHFQRWSNANPDKKYRHQLFGGYLSRFREFAGFRLPTHIEAGNFFGTDDYFPFYITNVTHLTFPQVK